MPNISAFLSYVIITTFTPGPNNIMSMSNASKYGLKKALPFNIGVFFGFFTIIALSSLFSASLISFIPSIKPIMTYLAAIYILYLAWRIYKSENKAMEGEKRATNTIFTGFILQFINLKVIIYGLTITSTFISPYYESVIVLGGFALMLAFISLLSTFSWAVFGSVLQKFFESHAKTINTIMALLLVYTAISLFF